MIYWGENLEVMRSMDDGSVDLIATDPPFNTGRDFSSYNDQWIWSKRRIEEFGLLNTHQKNIIRAIEYAHSAAMSAFCTFLWARLFEIKRILKEKGSIYLHCDRYANSYIRMIMDDLFGYDRLRNEIVWCYTGPTTDKTKQFPRKHDTIFWYSKSDEWVFNKDEIRIPYNKLGKTGFKRNGQYMTDAEHQAYLAKGKIPESWWADCTRVAQLERERVGYPTQKPTSIYTRIIQASCPEDGVVMDPFCGSGTTLVAAKMLGRRYIGIDENGEAIEIANQRLESVDTPLGI